MTIIIILHFVLCLFLVSVILVQPGKSDGGGIGFGSSSQSIFGSKGAGNFLTKTTGVVAVLFLATSFIITKSRMTETSSTVISGSEPPAESAPAPVAPAAPSKPAEAPKK